jgi:excisionase family DNA binding protein
MDKQHTTDTALAERSAIGPFYTTSEVSRMLHMSQPVVQEWVRTGQLRAAHYGTAWRISHADLEAFVAQASAPTPPAEADQAQE